jgi:hypothetical protein
MYGRSFGRSFVVAHGQWMIMISDEALEDILQLFILAVLLLQFHRH